MSFKGVVLSFLVLIIAGCTSVNIDTAKPISIPTGLTTQDVKVAILSAANPQSQPLELNQYQQITDNALKAHFGYRYQSANQRGRWFIEQIENDSIFIGYDNNKHYFRVKYTINETEITQKIDGSRNLNQTDTKIHKSVFRWLGTMETKIRQKMGYVLSSKHG